MTVEESRRKQSDRERRNIRGSMEIDLSVFICFSRVAKRLQDRLWGEVGQRGNGEGSQEQGSAEESQPGDEAKEEEEKREEKEGEGEEEERRMEEKEKEEEEEVRDIKVIKMVTNKACFLRHRSEYINNPPF